MADDIKKVNEEVLEEVAGGNAVGYGYWYTVSGLQTGYLAMRTAPTYDYSNEIRGSELYNGDRVQLTGGFVNGYDGRTYAMVFSPKTGTSGYVNSSFLVGD